MHLCLYISQSTFYPVSFQVYGHQRPDDGTAERFNKTRWRQWEKSCENAFEIAGGQKWGSTEPCCQMVRAWTVIAMFPGTNKAITDCRECVRAKPGPWHLPQTSFARDFALSCQALHFLCRHSQGVSVAARDYFGSTSVFLLQTLPHGKHIPKVLFLQGEAQFKILVIELLASLRLWNPVLNFSMVLSLIAMVLNMYSPYGVLISGPNPSLQGHFHWTL